MRNLIVPNGNGIDLYDAIVQSKREPAKARLTHIRPKIQERYMEYEHKKNELSAIDESQDFCELQKDSLRTCYGRNANFSKARKKILEIQSPAFQAKCPYCGLSEPSSIDHYLPKDTFPEFAIFGINLIPCCPQCNTLKGELWLDKGKRLVVNLYFDNIPDDKYLYAILNYSPQVEDSVPVISFEIRPHSNIEAEMFERIKSHLKILNLLERFQRAVNDKYSTIFEEVSSGIHSVGLEAARYSILTKSSILTRKYGKNHWEVALCEAIAASDDFFGRCGGLSIY